MTVDALESKFRGAIAADAAAAFEDAVAAGEDLEHAGDAAYARVFDMLLETPEWFAVDAAAIADVASAAASTAAHVYALTEGARP